MIKYHGTPVGGTNRDAMYFLRGRNALISFATKGHIPQVLECCDSFVLDNGAFTIWKKGQGKVDVPAYIDWVESLSTHPSFDFCFIPDVIGGTEEENDLLLEQWDCDVESVPVYHLGESVDRFMRLASQHKRVALGSTDKWKRNGSREWWKNMADFMDAITDERGVPPCKLHGLRMLDPKIFRFLPLSSADSTNAGVNGHLCMKKPPYPSVERWQGAERIAALFEQYQSASVWCRDSIIEEGWLCS